MTYDLHDTETRVTDAATGGQKGTKLTQVGALDPVAIIALARVGGYGAAKYAAFNYLKGYDYALSFNAMQRHAMLYWAGEEIDEESGQPHIVMAAWHALTLFSFGTRGVGTDTRPPKMRSTKAPVPQGVEQEVFAEHHGEEHLGWRLSMAPECPVCKMVGGHLLDCPRWP